MSRRKKTGRRNELKRNKVKEKKNGEMGTMNNRI